MRVQLSAQVRKNVAMVVFKGTCSATNAMCAESGDVHSPRPEVANRCAWLASPGSGWSSMELHGATGSRFSLLTSCNKYETFHDCNVLYTCLAEGEKARVPARELCSHAREGYAQEEPLLVRL